MTKGFLLQRVDEIMKKAREKDKKQCVQVSVVYVKVREWCVWQVQAVAGFLHCVQVRCTGDWVVCLHEVSVLSWTPIRSLND